jgi:hypothetical protein
MRSPELVVKLVVTKNLTASKTKKTESSFSTKNSIKKKINEQTTNNNNNNDTNTILKNKNDSKKKQKKLKAKVISTTNMNRTAEINKNDLINNEFSKVTKSVNQNSIEITRENKLTNETQEISPSQTSNILSYVS